jgi:hypothetical protein
MPCVCAFVTTRASTAKWAESSISPKQYPYTTDSPRHLLAGRLDRYQNHSPSQEWVFLILNHFLSYLTHCSIHAGSPSEFNSLLCFIASPTNSTPYSLTPHTLPYQKRDLLMSVHLCIL